MHNETIMRLDLALRAPRVITSDGEVARTIGVRDGRIVLIGDLDVSLDAKQVIKLGPDEVLLPGLVDTHVHINDPGRADWEGFATATQAAASGGVTTLIDMPLNSIPPTCDVAALQLKRKAAQGRTFVDVGFWAGAIPTNLGALRELHDAGVFGFKCFLVHSGVDEFPHLDAAELDRAMRSVASFGGLMIAHAEDPHVIADAPAPRGASYADFLASRPRAAEDAAIAGLIETARRTGCRTHVVHLSSSDAIPMIASARGEGVPVTVETCPHYLALSAEEIADGATQFKCCPPIREAANSDLLWQGLQDGLIDCVVSDHSPCTPDLKRFDVGDFGLAWGGVASLQLGLSVMWTQARTRNVSLVDIATWMATNPARLVGLQRKGQIALGFEADLCVLAPEDSYVVDVSKLHHKNKVTPYANAKLFGSVRSTWLRGVQVYNGAGTFGPPRGTLITRGAA